MISRWTKTGSVLAMCLFLAACGGSKEPGRYYGKGYSVQIPSDWMKTGAAPGSHLARVNKEGTITINIASQKLSPGITLEKVVEVTQARSRAGGLAILSSQEVMVGDVKGHMAVKNIRAMGKEFRIQEYHVVKNHVAYSIVFTVEKGRGDGQLGDIDPIVASFRFE